MPDGIVIIPVLLIVAPIIVLETNVVVTGVPPIKLVHEPSLLNTLAVEPPVQVFIGVREFLPDRGMERIMEYITDEFPFYSTEEIYCAVTNATAERTRTEEGRLIKHYNEFNATYLTQVLKAYYNFRGSIVRKYYEGEAALIEADKLKHKALPNETEIRKISISFAKSAFENHKTASPTLGLDKVFDFLQKEGILSVLPEKWEQYRQTAMATLKYESKRGNSIAVNILQALATDQSSNGSLEARIKTLAVKAYFEQIIAEGKDLSQIKPNI